MLFGPIFAADMVTSARRTRYYWLRGAYASLVLLFLAVVYVPGWTGSEQTIQSTAALANGFFSSLAYLQISAVLLLGPALTAGAIATERERRTIEYLFATDLSNVEIVYGKFAAALARMVVLLLVSIPILAIARLLGGIAYDRMLAVFAITASTAVSVVALSLTISVWSPRAREAVIRAYLCLFGLLVLPLVSVVLLPALLNQGGQWLEWFEHVIWLVSKSLELLTAANPYVALTMVLAPDIRAIAPAGGPWESVGILAVEQSLLVAVCAVLAPWGVRRVHLNAVGSADRRFKLFPWRRSAQPASPAAQGRFLHLFSRRRHGVSESRPMLWKELVTGRAQSRLGCLGRIVVGLVLLIIVGTFLYSFVTMVWKDTAFGSYRDEAFQLISTLLCTLVTCGALLLVAARAATSITSEKERDTWNALLATPLESAEIIWAKFWGSLYAARRVVPLLGFFWLLFALAQPRFLIGLPLVVATTAILGCFFAAVGLAFSLRCANSTRSLGGTLAVCIVLGGGYYLGCVCLLAPLAVSGGRGAGIDAELLTTVTLSPWPPFLIFAPHYLGQLLVDGNLFDELTAPTMAYLAGNLCYLTATGILLTATVTGFDRAVGRRNPQHRSTGGQQPGQFSQAPSEGGDLGGAGAADDQPGS